MFRLVVLSAFVAIVAAAPSGVHHHDLLAYSAPLTQTVVHEQPIVTGYEKTVIKPELTVVEEPTVRHVGNIVKSVPSAVSHHSSSVVHSTADYVEPILAHGVQKTVIETPKVEKHFVAAAPAYTETVVEAAAPLDDTVVVDARFANSFVQPAAPLAKTALVSHAPLAKTVAVAAPQYYNNDAVVVDARLADTYAYAAPYARSVVASAPYARSVVASAPYARTVVASAPLAKTVVAAAPATYAYGHAPIAYAGHHTQALYKQAW